MKTRILLLFLLFEGLVQGIQAQNPGKIYLMIQAGGNYAWEEHTTGISFPRMIASQETLSLCWDATPSSGIRLQGYFGQNHSGTPKNQLYKFSSTGYYIDYLWNLSYAAMLEKPEIQAASFRIIAGLGMESGHHFKPEIQGFKPENKTVPAARFGFLSEFMASKRMGIVGEFNCTVLGNAFNGITAGGNGFDTRFELLLGTTYHF